MRGRAKAPKALSSIFGSAVRAAASSKLLKSLKKSAPASSCHPPKSPSQTANESSNSDPLDSGTGTSSPSLLKM
ncbi:hypothetical protein ACLOJK_029345 [Asimina triloba]